MVKLLVIIDMGHGGSDPGAAANGVVEKTANYNTGMAMGDYLKSKNIKVLYTRTGDNTMSLKARTDLANKYARENSGYTVVFISVHHNAGAGDRGEYIHSLFSTVGQNLAKSIANEMTNRLGQQQKVYSKKSDNSNKDYYHVIRETSMPAIIVEVAFLDNKLDVQICDTVDEQKRNGRVIADGILKHYGLYTTPAPTPTPTPPTSNSNLYRVRKTWADAASQKGAYSDKNNAIAECKKYPGYKVFDSAGKEVYPSASSELYRVRKTWADAASQKGAYSDKNNAIAECKKYPGYKVFDSAGKEVFANTAGVLQVGSKVKVTGTMYPIGKPIPSFVRANTYTVKQISTDQVLLDEITSWVYKKDVKLV